MDGLEYLAQDAQDSLDKGKLLDNKTNCKTIARNLSRECLLNYDTCGTNICELNESGLQKFDTCLNLFCKSKKYSCIQNCKSCNKRLCSRDISSFVWNKRFNGETIYICKSCINNFSTIS